MDNYQSNKIINEGSITHASGKYPILEKLGYTANKDIVVKNPSNTEDILNKLCNGGFEKLQVVTDYDYTLTNVFDSSGQHCDCSWGVLDNSPYVPEFYRHEAQALFKKYYPMEISTTMTENEKIPYMVEWFQQVFKLLSRCSLSRSVLKDIVDKSNIGLRTGVQELFSVLHESQVPVLIFSAGLGDIIVQVFNRFNMNTSNVKIVSNSFKYDDEGSVIGLEGELIHMFNKNENVIHSSPYFKNIASRSNVILMGDSTGDTKMAVGVPSPNNVLKIGFLNEKIEERLETFEEVYDIVLVGDSPLDVVSDIVALI